MTDLEWRLADAAVRGLVLGGTLIIVLWVYNLLKKIIKKAFVKQNQNNSKGFSQAEEESTPKQQYNNLHNSTGVSFLKFFSIIILVLLPTAFYFAFLEKENDDNPKSYDDCILKYMSGAKDENAVKSIRHSCRKKFPVEEDGYYNVNFKSFEPSCVDIDYKKSSTEKLDSGPYNYYLNLSVNNKCKIYITSFKVNISDPITNTSEQHKGIFGRGINLGPNETKVSVISLFDNPAKKKWSIIELRGFEK